MNRKNDQLNPENSNQQVSNNDPALACFLNSLARESHTVKIESHPQGYTYQLPLSGGRTIHIPLSYFSQLGSHEYQLPALLLSGESVTTLSVNQLIELMVSRGLPASVFFKLIFNSLPQIIPTLLPIITGLSIFFVYSRMQTDREMVILQSSGFSNVELVKPVGGG